MMKAFAGTLEEEKAIIQRLLTDTKKDTIKKIAKQLNIGEVVYRVVDENEIDPVLLEFVFNAPSRENGFLAVKWAQEAFIEIDTLDKFDYAVYKTDACNRLNDKEWHTLYYPMPFDEFILSCNYSTNLGSYLLSGIKQLFPNDYEAVLKEYNENTFDSLESKAKALSYLLEWLSDKGITAQLAEKVDSRDQISGMLGVIMTDNEWQTLQHDWAAFCETPEKFKGTAVVEMVHAWLNDMRNSDEVGTTEELSVKSGIAAGVPLPDHLQPYQQEGPELFATRSTKETEIFVR